MHEKKMCPVGTEIQTLIFAHEAFKNEDYVKAWARANNFKYGSVDETDDSWRIRQQDPEHFIEKSFRTIPITDGVQAVIGCPIHKLGSGGFTNCGCFKKEQGGSLKTEYEELMSFTKNPKDINYFKKKYSDGQTQSSWLKPLQQYFVKASAHLSAERKKDEPNQDAVAFLKEQVRILEPMNTDFYKEVTKKEYATGGELTWMQDGNTEQQSSSDLAKELEELNKGVQYCLGQIAEAKEKWVKEEYKQVMNDRMKRIHEINLALREISKIQKPVYAIKQNADCPNYKRAIQLAAQHGYSLSKDVSYNGYIFFEKIICNGQHKLELQVYDDIKNHSSPDFTQYNLEADFGQSILSETTHRFKMEHHQSPWEAKDVDEIFAVALKKEKELCTTKETPPQIWKHKHMNATAKILGETAKGYKVELTNNSHKKPRVTTQYFYRTDFNGDKAIFEKQTDYATGGSVEDSFTYRMLGRLITDNDYFLGNGNRSEKHLWAGNVDAQIAEMKRLWNYLPKKPEWLSMDEILEYERKMKNPKLGKAGNLKFNAGGRIKGEIETGDTFSKILPQYYKGEVVDHIHKPIIIEAIKDDIVHFSPKSILTNGKRKYELHVSDFRKELNSGTIKSFDVATVNGETDQNMNSFISDIGQLMPFEMSELESVKQKFDLDSVNVMLSGTRSMIDGARTTNTVINIFRKSINNFREISITKISSGSLPDQFEKILVREVDNNDHHSYFVYNSIQDFCDNHFTRMKLGGSMKTVVLNETESPYAQLVISARDKHSFDRTCAKIEADDSVSEVQYMNMLDAVARTYGLNASSFENKSIGDYKQAIYAAAKNTALSIQTPILGSVNFDKAPVSFWNTYLKFVEGIDGIISEHGELSPAYWKKGVQEELDSITSAVKTKADIIANKERIIQNAIGLLDGLTGAISSGRITESQYFQPNAIGEMRKLLAHKYENGGSAGGLDVPLFSKDEMAIMRQVYNDRINGLLGKKSYLDTSNAKEWHSENNLSLTAAKQNADKELDEIKSDIEYLNSQKYPFELISSAYDCEKFLNDYNHLVKTKAGRELFGEDNPASARLYNVYLSLYDKLVQFCEKKFNRSF